MKLRPLILTFDYGLLQFPFTEILVAPLSIKTDNFHLAAKLLAEKIFRQRLDSKNYRCGTMLLV